MMQQPNVQQSVARQQQNNDVNANANTMPQQQQQQQRGQSSPLMQHQQPQHHQQTLHNMFQPRGVGPWNIPGRPPMKQQNSGPINVNNNNNNSDSFLGKRVVDLERAINHLLQLYTMSNPMYCPPPMPVM